jgi:hypothetical protein
MGASTATPASMGAGRAATAARRPRGGALLRLGAGGGLALAARRAAIGSGAFLRAAADTLKTLRRRSRLRRARLWLGAAGGSVLLHGGALGLRNGDDQQRRGHDRHGAERRLRGQRQPGA